MREFQEKRKFKKIIYSGWILIFLGAVFLALIFPTVKVYRKSEIGAVKSKEIKEEIIKLEKETQNWERKLRGWKANPAKKER